MNYSMIIYILGHVLKFEAIFMTLPCLVAAIYHEKSGFSFLLTMVICLILGALMTQEKPKDTMFFAREGFVVVSLSWIIMSIFGAIPFVISREIPSFTDALFESISGFTTTGASILTDVESLSHACLLWRCFTHWIGGMGVFVFILAVLPMAGGHNVHLLRTESPGPSVEKLVPRLKNTAMILYCIYMIMTLLEIIILIAAKMPIFDAITTSLSSAGTGGFAIKNDSMASYSPLIQAIIAVFIILFGVNFNGYYLLTVKKKRNPLQIAEVRWYFTIIIVAILIITVNIYKSMDSVVWAFHHAAFQVGSIITTTGYYTTDYNLWPQVSKTVLVFLMFIGSCAGSTGCGFKVSRVIILFKMVKNEMQSFIHPRSIRTIKIDGKVLEKDTLRNVSVFLITYVILYFVSMFILAFDNFDMVTNFTTVVATLNNIGPGLELIGPTGNYSIFSDPTKYVLMFNMLAGRLELYPILLLFAPTTWTQQ